MIFQYVYFRLCWLLIPFWTLPFIPGLFKPISTLLVSVVAVPYLIKRVFITRSLEKLDLVLICYITFSLLIGILFSFNSFGVNNVVAFSMFLCGTLSFFGYKYLVNYKGFEFALQLIKSAIYVTVLIGWVDLLSWAGLIPKVLGESLSLVLSGKTPSRIVLTTSEPAWACRLISLLLPFAWYFMKVDQRVKSKFVFYSLIIFFIATFSLSGVVILVFFVVAFLLNKFSISNIIKTLLYGLIIMQLFAIVFTSIKESGGYYVSRIDKIANLDNVENVMSLKTLSKLDGSAFIRLGYPIISFNIFLENPEGLGLGNYGNHFSDYVKRNMGYALENVTVSKHVEKQNADQRNFITKLVTDNGLVTFLFIVSFYLISYLQIKKILKKFPRDHFAKCLLFGMFFMFANMIQMASYLFISYWLIPALISCYYTKRVLNEKQNS